MDFAGWIEAVAQALATGLITGVIIGLMACGVGVIFGVMRVVNFAQGEFLMMGMYGALVLASLLGASQLLGPTVGAYAGAVLLGPLMFLFAAVVHRVLLTRVTGIRTVDSEGEGHYPQMILTLGLSLILQNVALMLVGSNPRQILIPISDSAWAIGPFTQANLLVFVNKAQFISCLLAAAVVATLYLFFSLSSVGKTLRAAADNPAAATYVGVDVAKAHRLAFGVGAAITAIAGGAIATYTPFQPYIGFDFLIVMYAAVVLGGLGSILGAFWGGLIIGLFQQFSTLILPLQLQSAAVFALFVLILFVRPQGLFGRSAERV
jgi:branched-chain amino acid transport system permease protein